MIKDMWVDVRFLMEQFLFIIFLMFLIYHYYLLALSHNNPKGLWIDSQHYQLVFGHILFGYLQFSREQCVRVVLGIEIDCNLWWFTPQFDTFFLWARQLPLFPKNRMSVVWLTHALFGHPSNYSKDKVPSCHNKAFFISLILILFVKMKKTYMDAISILN